MTPGWFLLIAMILIGGCLIGFAMGITKIFEDILSALRSGQGSGLPDAPQSIKDIPMPAVKQPKDDPGVPVPSEARASSAGGWVCCAGDGSSFLDALFPGLRGG